MLVSYTSIGLLATILSSAVQAHFIEPLSHLQRRAELQDCTNSYSTFTDSLGDWVLEKGSTSKNYEFSPEGLVMKIMPPEDHIQLEDNSTDPALPYNMFEGSGFTFNASTFMQYGRFTANIKSAKVPGAVTAVILIADNKDEIDFELLAGGDNTITTNYFYGKNIVYGKNGETTDPPAAATCNEFYAYTIDWTPERIEWSINGKVIRTKDRADANGEYPTGAARVQIGLWDGSGAAGTAQWARGPIDWDTQIEPITAYIKDVNIECSAQYNNVLN